MIKCVSTTKSETFTHFFPDTDAKNGGGQEIRENFSGETDQRKRKGIWKPLAGGPSRAIIHPGLPILAKGPPKHVGLQTSFLTHLF